MIGRKGKRPVLPRAGRQTKPRFVDVPADSGSKLVAAKGSKLKPAGPSLDECEVVPDDASGSHIIHNVVYDAAGRKTHLIGASDDEDLLFLPYPLDGAQEITSDDDPDLEIEYVLN